MMNRDSLQAAAAAALRIVSGGLFTFHGIQKIFGVLTPPDQVPGVGSQLWLGGLIELIGGLLIASGLFTRPAAFIASGTMAVAYLQYHWKFAFAGWKFLPAMNGGELSVVYCFLFLLYAVAGAGPHSLDAARGKA